MVASLLRLLHSGPQDERLLPKGNPDVTAFTSVLRKVGRFTKQWHRLDFARTPDFGQTTTCVLPTKGELLTRLYLVCNLPDIKSFQEAARLAGGTDFAGPTFGWTNSLGHSLIQELLCEIGGSRVEVLDGRLLEVMDEFNTPLEKVVTTNDLIGRVQNGFGPQSLGWGSQPQRVYIPLPFWFSRQDSASALPIDALNADSVKIYVTFRPFQSVIVSDTYATQSANPNADGASWWPIEGSKFYKYDASGSIIPGIGLGSKVSVIPDVQAPLRFNLGDTYLLAEYAYLDKPEANRFRINEIQYTIPQHYALPVTDSLGAPNVAIPIEVRNPCRKILFYAQRQESASYNAYFLATRDLSGAGSSLPWWPDCQGLDTKSANQLIPGFAKRGSEPFASIALVYEGSFVRYSTGNCAMFRSILPSLEEKKSPWHNRYMYTIPFGVQSGIYPASVPMGEVNLGRLQNKELRFEFTPSLSGAGESGAKSFPRLLVYVWLETYNIFKVYGGRGTLLFGY